MKNSSIDVLDSLWDEAKIKFADMAKTEEM